MGEFTVLRRMAIGGMAEIFLARRDGMSGFEKLVVLKRILPEFAHNQDFVRMFLNEARLAATLHHSNIVQVQGIGEESGQYFFAMEFLHGEDLARILSRATQIGRPLSLDAVLTIISAVCTGLHYAHERKTPDGRPFGIVHRDVSPHNVFVTYEGGVKLLDFGIAKATTSIGKTRTGVLKGKVAYMSPEQAYSQPVDRRSDIFCIGILLWEMTTGRRLYRRRSELETLKALVDLDAPAPSSAVWGYPTELERIVMKCLARDKADRWATCEELAQALETFARAQNIQVSTQIAGRMMRGLFDAEIASFREAIQAGGSVVEHIVARMEATSRSTVDDWDDVASIIVDLQAVDPEKTELTRPPAPPDAALDGPTQERPAIDATAEDTVTTAQPEPTPTPTSATIPAPRPVHARLDTPVPVLALAPQRPSTPPPQKIDDAAPTFPLVAPPSEPVTIPGAPTPAPELLAVTPSRGSAPDLIAPKRRGIHPGVWAGVAVVVLGIGAVVALRGRGGGDKPAAPAPETATTPTAPVPAPAAQPAPAAEPAPVPAAEPAPVPAPVAATPPTPPPTPVPPPTPPPQPPTVAETDTATDTDTDAAAEPKRGGKHHSASHHSRRETKKDPPPPAVKKPPTKKDLDSLPL